MNRKKLFSKCKCFSRRGDLELCGNRESFLISLMLRQHADDSLYEVRDVFHSNGGSSRFAVFLFRYALA